jgi:xanthine dehydrogenase small subunit
LFWRRELNGVYQKEGRCYVGASATVSDLVSSPIFQTYFPELRRIIKLVSSTPIRNMATVGGNFVNASPIGDMTIFFLALDAQLVLSDGHTQRDLPLRSLYKGYKQLDKTPDEFIKNIFFDLEENCLFNFEKVSKRTHLDIASVNTALRIKVKNETVVDASISAGGVGPIPMHLKNTSGYLIGKELTEELVLDAIEIAQAEVSPISDVRGSEQYKRLLLSQLIKAHFTQLFPFLSIDKLLATA